MSAYPSLPPSSQFTSPAPFNPAACAPPPSHYSPSPAPHPVPSPLPTPTPAPAPASAPSAPFAPASYAAPSYSMAPAPQPVAARPSQPPVSEDLQDVERRVEQCSQAEKIVRHALSALHFQDVSTAVRKLRESLRILTGEGR
eukprot:TRINITY_DN2095_c0_g3_i2.p1 TRINITY_DN2095_c0_g3~~TRINITY_DN2095_c0_g3_i2.p1  ORF type:complete len:142 (-),score=43.07 TRINITY_DN2095_c0_g3_i2:120-545(-)